MIEIRRRGRARRIAAAAALLALVPLPDALAQGAIGELAVSEVELSAYPQLTATVGVPVALGSEVVPSGAFHVLEKGMARPVEVMALPPDESQVMLVIDTSGSMTGAPLRAAKTAAERFLSETPAATKVAVIGFGPSPVLVSPFSLDREALAGAVEGLQAGGNTSLYDAVSMAVDQFPPSDRLRRSIVVLSDGRDTASATTLDAVETKLRASRVRVEVAELVTAESDPAALARVAAAGNGRVASADDAAGLSEVYRAIASALANQYRIAFTSQSRGPTEVVLRVDHRGVVAEHRVVLDLPMPLPARSVPEQGWPGVLALIVGGLAIFLAIAAVGMATFARPPEVGVGRLGGVHPTWAPATVLGRVAAVLGNRAESALVRGARLRRLARALDCAGLAMAPGEFAVILGSALVVVLVLGLWLSGLGLGLVLAGFVILVARFVLRTMTRRRRASFADQLVGTLQLLAGSLRTGYGLLQACEAAARETDSPTCDEFHRLLLESRLGRELLESLEAMAVRVASQDFEWVVAAIGIHREIGGDLAEVLDNVAGTIRERIQVKRQIKSLSAEGRLSSYVLLALPFVIVFALAIINPGYLGELGHGFGRLLVAIALGLLTIGALWLKRLCRLVF